MNAHNRLAQPKAPVRLVRLSIKILLLALLNVALLALALLLFIRLQFQFELSSFLLAPAHERMVSTSRLLALQLVDTPRANWTQVLATYSTRFPAEFFLFGVDGQQIAGKPIQLPASLAKSVKNDPFAHRRSEDPGRGALGEGPPGDRPPEPIANGGFNAPPPGPRFRPPGPTFQSPGPTFQSPSQMSQAPNRPRWSHFAGRRGPPFERFAAPIRAGNPPSYWTVVHIPIDTREGPEAIHAAVIWKIRSLWTDTFFFDYKSWLMVILVVIAVSVLCWLPFIRGLTRAIGRTTAATGRIADGNFEVKLSVRRRDELGKLSESINRMAERLAGLVYGQKRFLGDIAHELSSPIARIQVGLGILEQRAGEAESPYVEDVREEVQHMSMLVSELLAFSRAQAPENGVALVPVNVAQVVDKVLEREGSEQVPVSASVDQRLRVLAHPEFLFRALANVVRNAIRYAGDAGPIAISAVPEGEQVKISVTDNGPGIPERELENVFRPFYRPEFARQRETGGTGLGLAIVRDCVESCGGAVYCHNRMPSGLEVVIRLAAVSS